MYAWLSKMGSYKKTDGVPHTHTKMAGGNIYITDEDYDEFQRLYAKSFENGDRSMTFSERRSDPVFKMYFDIDILDHKVIDNEYVTKLVKVIQKTTCTYFPSIGSDDMRCVVSSTQPKEVTQKRKVEEIEGLAPDPLPEPIYDTFTKNGIHLVYPFLNVDLQMALQIRFTVTLALEVEFGKRDIDSNPWSDVIDKAPYFNGLKMCGSVKTYTCPECKTGSTQSPELSLVNIREFRRKHFPRTQDGHINTKFEYGRLDNLSRDEFKNSDLSILLHRHTNVKACSGCNGSKKKMEDRFYMPTCVVDVDGETIDHDTDIVKNSVYESVKWTSIRCQYGDECTDTYRIPIGAQVAPMESRSSRAPNIEKHLIKLSHGLYRESRNSDISLIDIEGMRHWNGPEITDVKIIEKIRDEIRRFNPHYSEIDVKNVFELNSAKTQSDTSANVSKIFNELNTHGNGSGNHHNIIKVTRTYTIRVGGKGSNYCCNKTDDHTSNTCYFTIGQHSGLKQRCFSQKDIVYKGGGVTCSKYSSKNTVDISNSLHKVLFKEELEMPTSIISKSNRAGDILKMGMGDGSNKKQKIVSSNSFSNLKKKKVNWDALK